jgi:LacI family transcriptional regulator
VAITQRQLAELVGVSQNAVSVAFGGRGSISEATRQRIMKAAQKHGYRVNTAARAMRHGRHNAIGVLKSATHPEAGGVSNATLGAMEEAAEQDDLRLVVGRVADEDLTREGMIPQVVREWAIDGLLVFYTSDAPQSIEQVLARYRTPAVWVNTLREHDCVRPDDRGIARAAAEHLLKLGHRRLAYLGQNRGSHYSASHRAEGFTSAVREAGGEPILAREAATDLQAAAELLRRPDRPTGLVLTDGFMSAVMAAVSLGLRIPQDLSLLVIRDYFYTGAGVHGGVPKQYNPTSIVLPTTEMGREAVAMLGRKIDHPRRAIPALALPGKLHEGKTCAACAV